MVFPYEFDMRMLALPRCGVNPKSRRRLLDCGGLTPLFSGEAEGGEQSRTA
jgi:hypothetical protein